MENNDRTMKPVKNIKVETIPNGYALTVGNNEYMYNGLEELLEGFLYHVGLEELSYMDRESIKKFVVAAVVWRADKGSTAKAMVKLREENDSLYKMCENHKRDIARLKAKVSKSSGRSKKNEKNDEEEDENEDE